MRTPLKEKTLSFKTKKELNKCLLDRNREKGQITKFWFSIMGMMLSYKITTLSLIKMTVFLISVKES